MAGPVTCPSLAVPATASHPRPAPFASRKCGAAPDRSVNAVEILLVEDDEGDVLMTREALDESNIGHELTIAADGLIALDLLRGGDAAPLDPDLILLDLNLPKVSGFEVLEHVKNDPHLRRIPIIVLTTSQDEDHILRCYDGHANAYVTKPVDFDQFLDVVRRIDDFFVSIVRLPGRDLIG
jgi:CheY-like chemotaxis protein